MRPSYDHLLSNVPGNNQRYYEPVNEFALEEARNKISDTLKEALEDKVITKEEYDAMQPEDKNASTFYCNFKVHKQKERKEVPPVRPIISGLGSITENISLFVEHHIKDISVKHESYLQDTPHFLRVIEKLNEGPKIPQNSVLVTSDATGAYHNIPQDDGSCCCYITD